jgi:UDP-glucuronate 4-epimerase
MRVLVTGAAGFIGYHTAKALLDRGDEVVGLDNLNAYYDVKLKEARVRQLQGAPGFTFHKLDLADRAGMERLFAEARPQRVIHLGAQAGVRYGMENPHTYVDANIVGTLHVLEGCRQTGVEHLVFASSSSVYGANASMPFSVHQNVDHPLSIYAASKKANELMAHTYAHLYRLPVTGLRFFTVYGPWGRPDMSPYIFATAIHEGRTIELYHLGFVKRDYSYIDDIVDGTIAVLDQPAEAPSHRLYNLGAARSEDIVHVVSLFEKALGREAKVELKPGDPFDMQETAADISDTTRDFGWTPKVPVEEGIPKFVEWFKRYNRLE